ncbi:hypothetical protein LCGC14_1004170 [marine sediment metagenome]|uniref:Uncharacterized protein n=1 Tax=marine sediment metagenome TaxID=412755 RepID=A0A0F9N267_9ZZZZ
MLPISLKEKIFRLPRASYVEDSLFDLNDPAWYVLYGFYVVDVRIQQLDFILTHPDYPATVWGHVYPDGVRLMTNISSTTFDFQELPAEVLQGCTICGQEVWIDLPIGHAEPYDEVFTCLATAMQWVRPHRPRKRQRSSDLNTFIRDGEKSIASTHHKPVDQMDFPRYRTLPERKMYWRRK